jgi:glyoxylase-like metal-dependent hydrolase (beta-lactamase superfamily II)
VPDISESLPVRPAALEISLGEPVEVAPGIVLLRLPLPFALDHINVYLLDDGEGWTLVDSGLDWPKSREAWEAALAHRLLRGRPLRRLIVTHHHPDHIGLAGWHTRRWDVVLEISAGEWSVSGRYGDPSRNPHIERIGMWSENGMARADAETLANKMPSSLRMIHALPEQCRFIDLAGTLTIGGRVWRPVVGRGHAPEHVSLLCESDDLFISGDHVLPRISPNISVWPEGPQNPLGLYLESLEGFAPLGGDPLVLPSHHYPFRGLATRVGEIMALHAERLDRLRAFCTTPRSAHDCLALLFNRPLRDQQMAFAMGEALAHLRYLAGTGEFTTRREGEVARYMRAA